MTQPSGVENAISELQQEEKNIQAVIGLLKKIQSQRSSMVSEKKPRRRKLSPSARRRISEAATKRWAALRSAKAAAAKAKS